MTNVTAGPLTTMPLKTSTTPLTFAIDAATSFAARCSAAVSSLKRRISTGAGELTRSPIRSLRMPRNSTRSAGSLLSIFLRSALVTSSVCAESRTFTAKSPVFGSVMPARPSCSPVRRE